MIELLSFIIVLVLVLSLKGLYQYLALLRMILFVIAWIAFWLLLLLIPGLVAGENLLVYYFLGALWFFAYLGCLTLLGKRKKTKQETIFIAGKKGQVVEAKRTSKAIKKAIRTLVDKK